MGFKIENQLPLEDGLNLYRIQEQVQKDFQSRGFPLPTPPTYVGVNGNQTYQGHIPSDLTQLSDRELGQYMTLLSNWMEYVGNQLALCDMSRSVAKAQLEFTESTIRLTYKLDENGKKRTVQERDDMVRSDRRFAEAHSAFLYLESLYVLTENVYKAARQNYNAVSRRITQRGQEIDQGNRTTNVNNMPAPGAPLLPTRRR